MSTLTETALKIQKAFPRLTWRQCLRQAAAIDALVALRATLTADAEGGDASEG